MHNSKTFVFKEQDDHFIEKKSKNLPQYGFKYLLSNLVLDFGYGFFEVLADGLALKRLHVEVIGLSWEDQKRNHCNVTLTDLKRKT